MESSQVVEGRSYLTQRKKKKKHHLQSCFTRAESQSTSRSDRQRRPPTASPASPYFVCPPRSHKIRAPAAVIASHRHQFPTALFLARPLPLPSPSPIAIPSSPYPVFRLSRSHHSSFCVPSFSSKPISRQSPPQPVPEVNGLRQPLAAVSRPLRGNPSPHTGTVEPYRIPDDKTNTRHRPRVASRGTTPRRLGAPTYRPSPPPRPFYLSGGPQPLAEAPL